MSQCFAKQRWDQEVNFLGKLHWVHCVGSACRHVSSDKLFKFFSTLLEHWWTAMSAMNCNSKSEIYFPFRWSKRLSRQIGLHSKRLEFWTTSELMKKRSFRKTSEPKKSINKAVSSDVFGDTSNNYLKNEIKSVPPNFNHARRRYFWKKGNEK